MVVSTQELDPNLLVGTPDHAAAPVRPTAPPSMSLNSFGISPPALPGGYLPFSNNFSPIVTMSNRATADRCRDIPIATLLLR